MARSFHHSVLLFTALTLLTSVAGSAQPATLGAFNIRVTRNGTAVQNATVCVGVSGDLNEFFQGQTDANGHVAFASVPADPFVVTANGGGAGSQGSFSPIATTFFTAEIALPASGGPSCPSTPAGPARKLITLPPGFVLPSPSPFTPITLKKTEFCFGALGAKCGQPQFLIPPTALCANGHCFINGGSWDHDECCFAHPQGMACRYGPLDTLTGNDGNCVSEWNKSLRLVGKGLMWSRSIDFTTPNTTGTVAFNLYCAPANTLLNPGDVAKCCSRLSRTLNAAETAAAVAAFENLVACR